MAIIRYEERVRVERANGLREDHSCHQECGCTPYTDEDYKGKTFADVAATPLRQNSVCPHPKVIVPVKPAIIVEETPKVHKPEYQPANHRLVDFNPCDGRTIGVVETINHAERQGEVGQAETAVTHSTTVVDTVWDQPNEVPTIVQTVKDTSATVEQPVKTGETSAKPEKKSKVNDGSGE